MLLLPWFAMQVTDQVAWDAADFAVFGGLLAGAGGAYELAARKTGNIAYRTAAGLALATAFILAWMNAAVGVIGDEGHPVNLMYGGVLAVGFFGAVVARFRPIGMARALAATALSQAFVAVIALTARLGSTGPSWAAEILTLNGFFAALWLLSAWLFRKAARQQAPAAAAA